MKEFLSRSLERGIFFFFFNLNFICLNILPVQQVCMTHSLGPEGLENGHLRIIT